MSERNYFHTKFDYSSRDAQTTWRTINDILSRNKSKTNISSFREDSSQVSDPNTIVNHFNEFFVNIGSNLARRITSSKTFDEYLSNSNLCSSSLFLNPVSEEEVLKVAFASLKPNKSAGSDNLKPDIIRLVIPYVLKP